MTITTGYETLGEDINKFSDKENIETQEGVVSEKLPELSLKMEDKELISISDKWEKVWNESEKKTKWEESGKDNENYWLGEHFDKPSGDKKRANVDNIIFESLETYLPQVTRRNPEPFVELEHTADEDDETNQKYIVKVRDTIADIGKKNKVRLKLKRGARHWAIYLLGAAKHGWDLDRNIPITRIIRPHKLILDPDAVNDEDGYSGDRIGEYRELSASRILDIVKNNGESKEVITLIQEKVKDNKATKIKFIEWWTQEYMFWKLDKTVLLKVKNPHWNYDNEEEKETVDEFGETKVEKINKSGLNHFTVPKLPYTFLTMYDLGDQPMDRTSLIGQNLANQDRINKRNRQIDANADNTNNGLIVSLERSGLTESQAKLVAKAIRKGGVVSIPTGSPQDAIYKPASPNLPTDIYNDLVDTRNRTRDIFGTRGSAPAGIESESTVRGKIMNKGLDTDRIGGGISEYLEQFAEEIYNWFLQLMYVYSDEFQFVQTGAKPPKVLVSVKEGSLLPQDSTTIANQAIELATQGKMSTIDMYKRLEYPNPEELAANVWLEQNAPQLLFKDNPMVQEALQMQAETSKQQMETEKEAQERNAEIEILKETGKQAIQRNANIAEEAGESLVSNVSLQD